MRLLRNAALLLVFFAFGLAALAACRSQTAQPTPVPATVAAGLDGATLLQDRCSVCHSPERAARESKTRAEWEEVVTEMIEKGAKLNAAEKTILVDYLAETYGP